MLWIEESEKWMKGTCRTWYHTLTFCGKGCFFLHVHVLWIEESEKWMKGTKRGSKRRAIQNISTQYKTFPSV